MSQEHRHAGQDEPRSYGQQHHHGKTVDLNSASIDEIAGLPMIGRERAEVLVENRPFLSWEDIERIPGFSSGMIDDLKSGGAFIDEGRGTEH